MPQPAQAHNRQVNLITLSLMALVLGAITGVGAIALRFLIGLIHNLFFLGEFSWFYEANDPTPASPFGPFIILAPVIGGAIVVFLVTRYAPEARGHGVPEVMDAIYYKNGRIRPAVVIIKSLASALSIGSGASVGREGPIIQIGSGMGSVLGQLFALRNWQVITLVAAGAGSGIAATFNTPLGAVMFTIELMLPEFSPRTLLPVVLATGTATYVGRLAFGIEPAFLVASHARSELFVPLSVDMLPLYIAIGILCGLASVAFVKVLHWVEDAFDAMPFNPYIRNLIGMTGLGVLMYLVFLGTGDYQTAGVGYATIQGILNGQMTIYWLLALLFVAKLAATTVSLAAGASGGVFSPSLFLGATLGGAFGALLDQTWPYLGFSPVPFAVIGMAGVVGGSTGATMTAIMMLFEMTGDYSIAVAAIIAVACAVGVRRALMAENIYTMKLARRGHHIPKERHSHMFLIRHARDVMTPIDGVVEHKDLVAVSPAGVPAGASANYAVVVEGRHITGVVAVDPENPTRALSPVLSPVGVARDDTFLQKIMSRMAQRGHVATLVVREGRIPRAENVIGVITRDNIAGTILADFSR